MNKTNEYCWNKIDRNALGTSCVQIDLERGVTEWRFTVYPIEVESKRISHQHQTEQIYKAESVTLIRGIQTSISHPKVVKMFLLRFYVYTCSSDTKQY